MARIATSQVLFFEHEALFFYKSMHLIDFSCGFGIHFGLYTICYLTQVILMNAPDKLLEKRGSLYTVRNRLAKVYWGFKTFNAFIDKMCIEVPWQLIEGFA